MRDTVHLIVNARGVVRMLKTRPAPSSLGGGERAITVSLAVPDEAFRPAPYPSVSITVEPRHLVAPAVTVEVEDAPGEAAAPVTTGTRPCAVDGCPEDAEEGGPLCAGHVPTMTRSDPAPEAAEGPLRNGDGRTYEEYLAYNRERTGMHDADAHELGCLPRDLWDKVVREHHATGALPGACGAEANGVHNGGEVVRRSCQRPPDHPGLHRAEVGGGKWTWATGREATLVP